MRRKWKGGEMKSIYHPAKPKEPLFIKLNLRAVRDLMPDHEIEDFELSQSQRVELQRRFSLYLSFGGKADFQSGTEDKPERFIPARVIKARPARIDAKGIKRRAEKEQRIPAKIMPAQFGIEPSIDHLPTKAVLEKVIRIVTR